MRFNFESEDNRVFTFFFPIVFMVFIVSLIRLACFIYPVIESIRSDNFADEYDKKQSKQATNV